MPRTLDSVITTGGNRYEKRSDSLGREYYVREGDGRVSSQQYAAAKSHSGPAEAFSRGHFEPDSVDQLGEPYDATETVPVDQFERGTPERRDAAEVNRWLGFRYSRDTPDDPVEAAEQYYEMKQELADADSLEREREIKRSYGIGGS